MAEPERRDVHSDVLKSTPEPRLVRGRAVRFELPQMETAATKPEVGYEHVNRIRAGRCSRDSCARTGLADALRTVPASPPSKVFGERGRSVRHDGQRLASDLAQLTADMTVPRPNSLSSPLSRVVKGNV